MAVKLFNDFSDDAVVGQILYFTGIVRLGSVVCGQPMAIFLARKDVCCRVTAFLRYGELHFKS